MDPAPAALVHAFDDGPPTCWSIRSGCRCGWLRVDGHAKALISEQDSAPPDAVYAAGSLRQMASNAEEAAEVAGADWARRVSGILAPLLWPSILVGSAVAFLFCVRDVKLPLLLLPPGHDTLTARTMTLMANGSPELIAAISLSVVPLSVLSAAWRAGSTR